MPTTDALIVAAIVLVFIAFGVVLAWADYQTRNLRPSDRQRVAEVANKAGATAVQSPSAPPARRKELNAA